MALLVLVRLFLLACATTSVTNAWTPLQSHAATRSRPGLPLGASVDAQEDNTPAQQSSAAAANPNKFAQPAFRQPAFAQPAHQKQRAQQQKRFAQQPTTKQPYASDSIIGSKHMARVKTAGRVGTKRYVNPCKVFIGNLPFDMTEVALKTWLCSEMGLPSAVLLNECKVVRDWKTGNSKGFGFAVFTEAIYATVCIDKCHNKKMNGRAVTVKQGVKKQTTEIYIKKKKAVATDADEEAIQDGMEELERLDPYEEAIVRRLDPDLINDKLDDAALFADENDDDYDGVDGVYVEDDNAPPVMLETDAMNREKRRKAAKQQKRRKLPHTGFGMPNDSK